MDILVLTGSPHKHGTSNKLAQQFIAGAEAAGHTVERFDAAFSDVKPCKGCYYCRKHEGKCVHEDDMSPLLSDEGKILKADIIVFATPLYYFGMSAQLKTVLDRFYSLGRKLRDHEQKAVLLATSGDNADWTMKGLVEQFRSVCRWSHWQEAGMILALGCHDMKDLEQTTFPQDAYTLGASLKVEL